MQFKIVTISKSIVHLNKIYFKKNLCAEQVLLLVYINPLKMKHNLFYVRTQFVLCSKHTPFQV
jgi:Gpi18-like mannosyltransferase